MSKKILKATHQGDLQIGDIKIPSAVLEDETRVIREYNVAKTLGSKGSATYWEQKKKAGGRGVLPGYVHASYLQPFISDEIRVKLLNTISYKPLQGTTATGIEATLLPEICHIWIKAREKRVIPKSQEKTAQSAEILLKGFAVVGITALIDEAAGYQDVRAKKALADILEKYLVEEYHKWTKTFPDEFYREMFRLKGWHLDPTTVKRPQVIGTYTNEIVYQRLAPGVLKELQKRNPTLEKGYRKQKHTQWFTPEFGHPKLKERLEAILAIMKLSNNWRQFRDRIQKVYPKPGEQIPLSIGE